MIKWKIFEQFEFCAKSISNTPEKMSWANAHLNMCKLIETELRLAQRLTQLLYLGSSKFKLFKDSSFYHRSTSFEQSSSSFNLAVHTSQNFLFYFLMKSLPQDFIKMILYLILINSCTFFKCQRLRHLNNMTLGWPFYLQFR